MATLVSSQYRYPGTKPFEAADHKLFKGRDQDILKLFQLIFLENPVVLFSRSGLGKSSLLNAGLNNKIINEQVAVPIFVRFGACYADTAASPLQKLMTNFRAGDLTSPDPFFDSVASQIPTLSDSLWYAVKRIMIKNPEKPCFLLIFDQFEELFTYPPEQIALFKQELSTLIYMKVPQELRDFINERRKFDHNFISKEQANLIFSGVSVRMLFAIRNEKLSLLNGFTDFFPTILKNCYQLRPLSREQAEEAIILPAHLPDPNFESPKFGYHKDAVSYILDSLKATTVQGAVGSTEEKQDIETFQLQIVCKYAENLVVEKGLKEISKADLGEIQLIFEHLYENIIRKLPEKDRVAAQTMIEDKLIVQKIRVSIPEISLLSELGPKGLTPELIDQLVNTHIIRRDQSGTVEVSHDTLVEPVLKLKKERDLQERHIQEEAENASKKKKAEQEEKEFRKTKATLRQTKILLVIAFLGLVTAGYFWYRADFAKKEAELGKVKLEKQKIKADSLQIVAMNNLANFIELKKTSIGARYQGGIICFWKDSTGKHGLIAAEKDLPGLFTWDQARQLLQSGLNIGGYTDWRLPNKEELAILYANRFVLGGFANGIYWSGEPYGGTSSAWQQGFLNGNQNHLSKAGAYHIRPVRNF